MPAGIVYFIVWTRSVGKVMDILIPPSNRISFTVIFMLTLKEIGRIVQSFLARFNINVKRHYWNKITKVIHH